VLAKETYVCGKRDSCTWQKRPVTDMSYTVAERERERERFIRNYLHNGVVSGAAR
jgi:hypothetical protein